MERNGMEHRPLYIRSGITERNETEWGRETKGKNRIIIWKNRTERNGMEHTQTSVYIIRNKGTEQKGNEQNGVN